MQIKRRKAKAVKVGDVSIGGNNPIAIQSMAKTATSDIDATLAEIKKLQKAGCEIVRLAVRDAADARALRKIKRAAKIPLVADIHFDWRLALTAIEAGVDKIRLNPGNIRKKEEVKAVAKAAKAHHIPIRVGVNSGSVNLGDRRPVSGEQARISEAMVRAALDYIKILEGCGFYDTIVSLKGSSIFDTLRAYRRIARACDYPLHLGITATGTATTGVVKSSIGLGALLLEGLGDTIRVSLTASAEEEVKVAQMILEALRLRKFGPEIISCPTCGRCAVDLIAIVKELEERLSAARFKLSRVPVLKVAVMGCVVNGPQEARLADLGVAFGSKEGLFFKEGKPIKKISPRQCLKVLLREINKAYN